MSTWNEFSMFQSLFMSPSSKIGVMDDTGVHFTRIHAVSSWSPLFLFGSGSGTVTIA